MLYPKPLSQRRQRQIAKADRKRIRRTARAAVVARDPTCRVCHQSEGLECHELRFRSSTSTLRHPDTVFCTQNMLMLCRHCHHDLVHGRRIDLVPVDADLGADGTLEIQRRIPRG
jgi:5-methylcytosine-specific restriction endonuclease McrA